MAQFSTAEPRSVCLSVSKKNQDAKDIAESWASAWGWNCTNPLEDRARTQPDEEMDLLQPMRGTPMALASKTQSRLQEIQRKVKSSITGSQEFKTRDEVIDLAVEQLYDQLKKQRLV